MNILFLCTGNSCRSQMAEGWGKSLKGKKYNFYSAGTQKHDLNSRAVKVMSEMGIDISGHKPKTLEDLKGLSMDYVFTVCSDAHESCPVFLGSKIIHVGFDDPPRLTKSMSNEEDIMKVYRRVRDEIKTLVLNIESYLGEKNES